MIRSLIIIVTLAIAPLAVAQPSQPAQFGSPTTCTTAAGSRVELPVGWWIVPPDRWDSLDSELKRLQTAETRLTAENESMRASLAKIKPRWYWYAGALAAGYSAGLVWRWTRD